MPVLVEDHRIMRTRLAYMPLATYPETVPDDAIRAAVEFTAALGHVLHVTTFAVSIPQIPSPLGGFLLDIPGLVHAAEDKSKAESARLRALVQEAAGSRLSIECIGREVVLGAALDAAATEARYCDLVVLPWSSEAVTAQQMAQTVVFDSGRPVVLVPPAARVERLDHVAVAWDGSRVAARALGDALPLLAEGGRVSVLTVRDEKPLRGPDLAESLASWLQKRSVAAKAVDVALSKRPIADALQESALTAGAQALIMGGFGHSRLRDFVLGGATEGVLTQLRLPTLLSH